ncbi:MAG: nucleoside triphosphate pyrophosphohydrolase [Candidatus Cloacimonetes bacterium]|nr:nucleoside triphosphate pyrophosphohydrolase [Candidatus Cloacimonadota bacterium]
MKEFDQLVEIISRLRDPQNGCPWDLQQTSESLIPNFIEELYECVEAIENGDHVHLSEELGDLLLHILMQARIAQEAGNFSLNNVLEKISQKLINRHPHVFGDKQVYGANNVKMNWERIKQKEKKDVRKSVLDGIPKTMPALIIAQRIQEKAASVGFDWEKPEPVITKLDEELSEFKKAFAVGDQTEIQNEIGDVIFTVVNLARKLGFDAESCLRKTITKFENRFNKIEQYHQQNNENIYESSLEKLDEIWNETKKDGG